MGVKDTSNPEIEDTSKDDDNSTHHKQTVSEHYFDESEHENPQRPSLKPRYTEWPPEGQDYWDVEPLYIRVRADFTATYNIIEILYQDKNHSDYVNSKFCRWFLLPAKTALEVKNETIKLH